MNLFLLKKNNANRDEQAKADALLDELEIQTEMLNAEARIRIGRLDLALEEMQHDIKVAEYEAHDEVEEGMRAINIAADAIVLPQE
jgi:hypothetical protein